MQVSNDSDDLSVNNPLEMSLEFELVAPHIQVEPQTVSMFNLFGTLSQIQVNETETPSVPLPRDYEFTTAELAQQTLDFKSVAMSSKMVLRQAGLPWAQLPHHAVRLTLVKHELTVKKNLSKRQRTRLASIAALQQIKESERHYHLIEMARIRSLNAQARASAKSKVKKPAKKSNMNRIPLGNSRFS